MSDFHEVKSRSYVTTPGSSGVKADVVTFSKRRDKGNFDDMRCDKD